MKLFHSDEKSVDKGWAWMILAGAVLWNVAVSGTIKSFGVLFVEFLELFETTPAETAWISATFHLMISCCWQAIRPRVFEVQEVFCVAPVAAPVAGKLSDHVSPRWVLLLGSLVASSGVFFTAFAPSLIYAVVSFGFIAGGAIGVMDSPVFAILNTYFKNKQASANSFAFVGSGFGCFVVPILLRICVDVYSIRGTMIVLAGVWLQPCIIGALFRPMKLKNPEVVIRSISERIITTKGAKNTLSESKSHSNLTKEEVVHSSPISENMNCHAKAALPTEQDIGSITTENCENSKKSNEQQFISDKHSHNVRNSTVASALRDYLTFLRNPRMIRILFAIMFGCFAYFNQIFLFPSLVKELQYGKMQGAVLISITGIAEMLSRIPLGCLSDKAFVNKQLLVACLSMACCVMGLVVSCMPHAIALNVYAAVMGVIGGTTIPLAMPMLTAVVSRENIGSASGLFLFAMSAAFAMGPPILGEVQMVTGSYKYSFSLSVSMYFPAVCLLLWNVRTERLTES